MIAALWKLFLIAEGLEQSCLPHIFLMVRTANLLELLMIQTAHHGTGTIGSPLLL